MGDPQPRPTTVTPLHIVPESILVKGEEGQYMDLGMTGDEEEEQQKPNPSHAAITACSVDPDRLMRALVITGTVFYSAHSLAKELQCFPDIMTLLGNGVSVTINDRDCNNILIFYRYSSKTCFLIHICMLKLSQCDLSHAVSQYPRSTVLT